MIRAVCLVLVAFFLGCPLMLHAQPRETVEAVREANRPAPLPRFNLEFKGGTPRELAEAIERATRRPLNVIIPEEHADTRLPPLKMTNVDVPQLFTALGDASQRSKAHHRSAYGFVTKGKPSEDSIWHFRVEASRAKQDRFFPLAPYLEKGYTVEQITSAVETAWAMLGIREKPSLTFHRETMLLVAVGDEEELDTIQRALSALDVVANRPGPNPHTQAVEASGSNASR